MEARLLPPTAQPAFIQRQRLDSVYTEVERSQCLTGAYGIPMLMKNQGRQSLPSDLLIYIYSIYQRSVGVTFDDGPCSCYQRV